jgi:hypothetical protein
MVQDGKHNTQSTQVEVAEGTGLASGDVMCKHRSFKLRFIPFQNILSPLRVSIK